MARASGTFASGESIDGAGHDSAAWHPVVVGLFRILCDNQSAHLLDRLCPSATIRAGSREDDADGALTELLGERVQQEVERQSHTLASPGMGNLKCAVAYREIASGRDDVDVVRFEPHVVASFEHRPGGMPRQ